MATKKNKNRAAEAAAMFEVTSMSSEQLSAIDNNKKETLISDLIKDKADIETEKQHNEELKEAKMLGIEDTVIVESTNNEVTKDLEKKLEECQARYLEAVDDKKTLEKENNKLNRNIAEISSQLDLLKIDTLREITNYKVEISDLNDTINIYKANEANYKAEIASLKESLTNLEKSLVEANKILNNGNNNPSLQNGIPKHIIPMFTTKRRIPIKRPAPNNGYSGWN